MCSAEPTEADWFSGSATLLRHLAKHVHVGIHGFFGFWRHFSVFGFLTSGKEKNRENMEKNMRKKYWESSHQHLWANHLSHYLTTMHLNACHKELCHASVVTVLQSVCFWDPWKEAFGRKCKPRRPKIQEDPMSRSVARLWYSKLSIPNDACME